MFYYPNRSGAIGIQRKLEELYNEIGGRYVWGNAAWDYVRDETGVNLKSILERIADERRKESE